MDTQIRITDESHKTLKNYADTHGITMKAAAELAISGLSLSIVVAVDPDGRHDIVEAYVEGNAEGRLSELERAGFIRSLMSETSTWMLSEPAKLRKYGPDWIEATGWIPSTEKVDLIEAARDAEGFERHLLRRLEVLVPECGPAGAVAAISAESGMVDLAVAISRVPWP